MSPQGDGKAEKENPTTIVNSNQRILPTYLHWHTLMKWRSYERPWRKYCPFFAKEGHVWEWPLIYWSQFWQCQGFPIRLTRFHNQLQWIHCKNFRIWSLKAEEDLALTFLVLKMLVPKQQNKRVPQKSKTNYSCFYFIKSCFSAQAKTKGKKDALKNSILVLRFFKVPCF